VATPFVSTSHYQLLAGLRSEGVDPKGVDIVNLRPPEIAAAWDARHRRGLHLGSGPGPHQGQRQDHRDVRRPRQEGISDVRRPGRERQWAAANEAFVTALVKAVARRSALIAGKARRGRRRLRQVQAIAKWSKADPRDVPAAIALYRFRSPAEQVSQPGWGAARRRRSRTPRSS
jgi:taurine transport system substrate-binding protein